MIGKLLKSLRTSKGDTFTLDFIQEKSGVPKGHLSRIENDKVDPTDEMLFKILSHAFDLKPSEAKQIIATWRTLTALDKAPDPSKVINSIVAGDKSIIIMGNDNKISK